MPRYICIHGHFYQPPRENPWLEEVELQDSAYPYHDWNARITAECYAPNTASRILDADEKIIDIINNFSRISFNVGPTLLSWMERHEPEVYQAILQADKESMQRFSGHGSAIAQVYNHMIMPLANRGDKYVQALWGIRDFEKRFGRYPEGMWLSETAVDLETLEVLAELGITFTVLAPRQAQRVKQMAKGARWHDVSGARVDPSRPYLCQLPSGKSIALFSYDGPISQDIAFGGLLNDGVRFAQRLIGAFREDNDRPQIVNIATDGESYGHHHRYGEMALSYALYYIESTQSAELTNYGAYLAKHPPTDMVEIIEMSSWSCVHGVERWRENCGCNSGRQGWTQEWRRPLRESLDALRDRLIPLYEQEASVLLRDPWHARNEYIDVVFDRSRSNVDAFFARHAKRELSGEEKTRALKLLEMQRGCMLMYTSCGWFFDEISGIETTQVLQYASIVMQYAEELFGEQLEPEFLGRLGGAPSNVLETGAKAYELNAKPARLDLLRVAAHFAISSLFVDDPQTITLYCYTVASDEYQKQDVGRFKLAIGKTRVMSDLTWEERPISFAVLHFGDHNIRGGVRDFMGDEAYALMKQEIIGGFEKGDMSEVITSIGKHFTTNSYSLWHLFKDEQRKVLREILEDTLTAVESSFQQIYETNYSIMTFLQSLGNPVPKPLLLAAEYFVNKELREVFENEEVNLKKLEHLIQQTRKWSFKFDRDMIRYVASSWVNSSMVRLKNQPENRSLLEQIDGVLEQLDALALPLNLWKAQNFHFALAKEHVSAMNQRAQLGEEEAKAWFEAFSSLGAHLHVKVEP